MHRDVKPENILVGEFGEVVVLDWGVAKVWADSGDSEADERMQNEVLTDVNQRPGTPLYMSPEQVRGGGAAIDHRTDVYSLGAVLYEFLTLSEPLRGKRVQDTFEMIVSETPDPPRERAPQRQIPQPLADIAMRALAKRSEDRFATMNEFIEAIRDFTSRARRRPQPDARLGNPCRQPRRGSGRIPLHRAFWHRGQKNVDRCPCTIR